MNGGDKMLSNIEKETIILFNDAEDTASVYTCNNSLKNKLDRFCSESQEFSRVREDEYSKTYKVPKKCVKIYKPLLYHHHNNHKIHESWECRRQLFVRKDLYHKRNNFRRRL